ncbi:MAG: hypothetical protein A4E55_00367 [Pelotomaculum sp. PtaU1.Bin035]|nr:MAG: hypothetical protein A4E55_00367 [Pelotomaculum sp. PtaU1.Bin035]
MKKMADLLSNMQRPGMKEKSPAQAQKEEAVKHPLFQNAIYYEDPRKDLEEDSNLWCQMLAEADKVSDQLRKNLWDMRTWGTRIVRGKTQFVLRPDIDPTGAKAWPDREMYEEWRDKLLKPYAKQIGEILKNLFVWGESER